MNTYVVHYDTAMYKYTCVVQVPVSNRKAEIEQAKSMVRVRAEDCRRVTSVCGPVHVFS